MPPFACMNDQEPRGIDLPQLSTAGHDHRPVRKCAEGRWRIRTARPIAMPPRLGWWIPSRGHRRADPIGASSAARQAWQWPDCASATLKGAPLARLPPSDDQRPTTDFLALLRELSESLTAIANYAAGARHLVEGPSSGDMARLESSLESIIEQVVRAANATRRLRSLADPPSAQREGGQ